MNNKNILIYEKGENSKNTEIIVVIDKSKLFINKNKSSLLEGKLYNIIKAKPNIKNNRIEKR